ncbi:MAG TPA: metallopeptidase [Pirellulales bacterium]|nr:metallopeptidase [Pirellulales bacterium]
MLAGAAAAANDADRASVAPYEPTSGYAIEHIEGWTVRVHRQFREHKPQLYQDTFKLLGQQLYLITRNVPPAAVEKLRQIVIWVEEAEPHHPCMAYHPDAGWLRGHDMNPDKARCVELANAENFLKWTHEQPWMVFHELAHGYHHQFLEGGFDNQQVRAAFDRATAAKTYENVLRFNGRRERHYALTNPQEYFAEASEAYFGTNDFYPFVRAELRELDPHGCDLLARLWGAE